MTEKCNCEKCVRERKAWESWRATGEIVMGAKESLEAAKKAYREAREQRESAWEAARKAEKSNDCPNQDG